MDSNLIELDNDHETPPASSLHKRATASSPLLTAASVCVLAGILVAGLWPFHAPANEVTWLGSGNGLHLGDNGTLLSAGEMPYNAADANLPCSLEIWLQPGDPDASAAILAFYAPGASSQFSLRQSKQDLELVIETREKIARPPHIAFYADNVFAKAKSVFITITSGSAATRVFLDGKLAREASRFPLTAADFKGTLVVANSPFQNDSWSGNLRGLAFYGAELSPSQALDHYKAWTSGNAAALSTQARLLGFYLFNEHAGSAVHNYAKNGVDLAIPAKYTVLHEKFLESPWQEFSADWWYLKDILINIAGFVPLGFLFRAGLEARRVKRAAAYTIMIGAATSITIEVLQAFLPTRDSGMTDILTNTLGTATGVMLYPSALVRRVCAVVPLASGFCPEDHKRPE